MENIKILKSRKEKRKRQVQNHKDGNIIKKKLGRGARQREKRRKLLLENDN